MTHGLARRLNRIECALVPRKSYPVVLRFEGPGSERFRQLTVEEIREATQVLNIRSEPRGNHRGRVISGKNLSRRLERLEAQIAPPEEHVAECLAGSCGKNTAAATIPVVFAK
jgi:hypothetical protein